MSEDGTTAGGSSSSGRAEPLVSIAMATFNGADFIGEQIRSILGQTHRNIELVISDDGSTDGTMEICAGCAAADQRIRILPSSQGRLGLVRNFERALDATVGPFVALSDQDDTWRPRKLERLLAHLGWEPAVDLVFCDLSVVDASGGMIHPSMTRYERLPVDRLGSLRQLVLRNCVTGCATLFRRSLLERALPFPDRCHFHDWWLAVVAGARGAIRYVDEPLVLYRQHGSNTIGARGSGFLRMLRIVKSLESATDPRRYGIHAERLASYLSRDDLFPSPGERAVLEHALSFMRAMTDLPRLSQAERIEILRTRLHSCTRRTPTDVAIAVAGTLLPLPSRWVVRLLQRLLRPRSGR